MTIRLQPQGADWLVALSSLLRPLVYQHWTRAVAQYNSQDLPSDRLQDILFGASRIALGRIVSGLRDIQGGLCFYCGVHLQGIAAEVDHFVPWSRIPNDALANLVLADRRCNNSKRDHLAAWPLVVRWAERPTASLGKLATDADWPLGQAESIRIARGIYAHLSDGAHLWAGPSQMVVSSRNEVVAGLARLKSAKSLD